MIYYIVSRNKFSEIMVIDKEATGVLHQENLAKAEKNRRYGGLRVVGVDTDVYPAILYKWIKVEQGKELPASFMSAAVMDLYRVSSMLGATVSLNDTDDVDLREAMFEFVGMSRLFEESGMDISDIEVTKVKIYPTGHTETSRKRMNIMDMPSVKSNPLWGNIEAVGRGMDDEVMSVVMSEASSELSRHWGLPTSH